MNKKIVSALLLLLLLTLTGFLPRFTLPAHAAGSVLYEPVTTEYAILNKYNYNNSDYFSDYVKNTNLYNAISKFSGLSAGATYTTLEQAFYWNNFLYDNSNNITGYGKLAEYGQLQVNISATLHNVSHKHGNFLKNFTSVAYQYACLSSGDNSQIVNGYDLSSSGTVTQRLNDRSYTDIGYVNKIRLYIGVGHTHTDCNDGACTIGDIAVSFADTKCPYFTGACACDINGNEKDLIKAGDPFCLKLMFSEPIRFADNNVTDHSGLTVTIKDKNDHQFTGNLVALKDTFLMFQFDNTSVASLDAQNLVMTNVDLSKLFENTDNKRNFMFCQVKNGSVINGSINSKYVGNGYNTSESLITDIAGNPLTKPSDNGLVAPITNPCYIDGEEPYVAGITKTTQMNNSDVKSDLRGNNALSGNGLDASDRIAGAGDTVTFTANFNEKLCIDGSCYNSNYFLGMLATLNVRDSHGNPVKVRALSMSQVSGGSNCDNGYSKGTATSVTFQPFILAQGMTCDDADGKLKVVALEPYNNNIILTDLAGNSYSVADLSLKNDNPLTVDLTGPTVTTSITPSGGKYTPIPVSGTAAYIKEFYFPLNITDSSGTNALNGSFMWSNGVNADRNCSFEYAVTGSNDEPAVWQSGTTGQYYPFVQVSAGDYIHIRLLDGGQYNLGSTSISVKAKDYAGNSARQTFPLNYTADTVAPSSVITSTGRIYDNLSQKGIFTANININDDIGLATVGYAWKTDGLPPDAGTNWTPAGTFNSGDLSTTFQASYNNITSRFAGAIYVRAADTSGNISVTDLGSYIYDLSEPAHKLAYNEDATKRAALQIYDLASDSAAVVMVKKPGTADTYYVSVIDAPGYNNDIFKNTSVTSGGITNVYSWCKYTVTNADNVYHFTYLGDSDSDPIMSSILGGYYYGELDVTVLTGAEPTASSQFTTADLLNSGKSSIDYNNGGFTFTMSVLSSGGYRTTLASAGSGSPVYAENIKLKAAPGISDVYNVYITTPDTLSRRFTSNNPGYPPTSIIFNPDSNSTYMLSTLAGVTFNISLSNLKVSGWGVEDVDFKKSYLSVYRYSDENGNYINTKIGDYYLGASAFQDIKLSAADYSSGQYNIKLTLTAKASGQTYTFDYSQPVYVDSSKASTDFGFAGYSSNVKNDYYNISKTQNVYYGPLYSAVDSDSKEYTQYTAGDSTVYIPVNSGVGSDGIGCKLFFTVNDVNITGNSNSSYYGTKAIKAWNVTEGTDAAASKSAAAWYSASDAYDSSTANCYYIAQFVDTADKIPGAYVGDTVNFGYLPLIKNKLNTIAFQVMNGNGTASEVRYVCIYPMENAVSGTVSLTAATDFVKQGQLTFTPGQGQSMLGVKVYAYDYSLFDYGQTQNGLTDITENYDPNTNTYSLPLTQTGAHFYFVYTVDSYGNYTLFDNDSNPSSDAHLWTLTDSGAPAVISSSCSNIFNGKFAAIYVFSDDTIMNGNTQTLNVYFDSVYMKALGLNSQSSDGSPAFTLNIPVGSFAGTKTLYAASKPNPYGIYQVDIEHVSGQDKQLQVTVYGVVKYDITVTENSMVSHTLYATLTDSLGYVSDPGSGIGVNVRNTKPAYVSGSYDQYSTGGGSTSYRALISSFNMPVMTGKSAGTNNPSAYGDIMNGELPVFGDGTYDISFYDIFGTEWKQQITVDNSFSDYSLHVSLSNTGWTSDPVTVTITADHPDTTSFTVVDSTNGGWTYLTNNGTNATFSVSANSEYHIVLKDSKENNTRVDEMFYITNIISGAPTATVHWYYSQFKSDTPPNGITTTTGAVTAWYTATRDVTASDGTASSYTFYPGSGETSYTFKFTDEAGNEGTVTADLPITLEEPALPVPDNTPPTYEINICGMSGGVYSSLGYYSSTTSADSLDTRINQAGYVQAYKFEITAADDSPYKFILLSGANASISGINYTSSSGTVDGVTIDGRIITAVKASAFTAAIVDKSDNVTSFSMNLGQYFDKTAPTLVAKKVYTDFYKVRAYVKPDDLSDFGADTGSAVLLSPADMILMTDNNSPYYGQYYCDFTENKSVTVTSRDGAGNKSSTVITVDSLDTYAPTASVTWSPCYYGDLTAADSDPASPPNHLTNRDVTADVSYNKSVSGIKTFIAFYNGSIWSGWTPVTDSTYDSYFTLNTADTSAAVTFHAGNTAVQLTASALNGKTVTTALYLGDVISKTIPWIAQNVTYNCKTGYNTPYSATIKLTPANDVYCPESGTPDVLIKAGKDISFTVYSKGNYYYHFADKAGNQTVVTVAVSKIIDNTAPVITVDTGSGALTGGSVDVSVSSAEEGTITVIGVGNTSLFSGAAAKDTPVILTITKNGSYSVTACDSAGNSTSAVFVIGCIDNTPPSVAFKEQTVSVKQDTDITALKALLDSNFIVSDNISAKAAITVTYDSTGVSLGSVGTYGVTYTAADEAGNTATAKCFIRVYPKGELIVLINGRKADNGGTISPTSNTVTLTVANPAGNEPYKIYLKKGINTEGQMKQSYTVITPDNSGYFTVPSSGFYTLYIVTQSRQTYLATLYFN